MAQKAQSTPTDGDFPDIITSEDELISTASVDLFNGPVSVTTIEIDGAANDEYVKIYDALTVDASSDKPDIVFPVPGNQFRTLTIIGGLSFTTGFSVRAVTGGADTDTTDPTTPAPGFFVGK